MAYNNDIDALKALYTKLGGADSLVGVNTSSGVIEKIGELAEWTEQTTPLVHANVHTDIHEAS